MSKCDCKNDPIARAHAALASHESVRGGDTVNRSLPNDDPVARAHGIIRPGSGGVIQPVSSNTRVGQHRTGGTGTGEPEAPDECVPASVAWLRVEAVCAEGGGYWVQWAVRTPSAAPLPDFEVWRGWITPTMPMPRWDFVALVSYVGNDVTHRVWNDGSILAGRDLPLGEPFTNIFEVRTFSEGPISKKCLFSTPIIYTSPCPVRPTDGDPRVPGPCPMPDIGRSGFP
jgi:hypothetical protein